MDTIVDTTYELFNRKIFSLPKVLLLPMIMTRQPKMMVQIFPIIFATDWIKGRAVSYMTSRIENLQKETQELSSIRSKVEAFDIKSAELLQRAGPGATDFTRRRWEELTVQVQMKNIAKDLTSRTKDFFAFIQRNFVFTVLVDCALAHLIAVGKLVAADVFVFSRAIEDAVDMVLMKSRSEAELARMMTQIEKMKELANVWDKAKARNLIHCNLAPSALIQRTTESQRSLVVLRNLLYSRGTAMVRVDHLELQAGVYALTGANGSGKSTLFRVLMSCDTNERSIDLPSSIVLSTPNEPIIEEDDLQREVVCEAADEKQESNGDLAEEIVVTPEGNTMAAFNETHPRLSITMPSSHVVEISQTFYWPLYTKPIDWIYQEHVTETRTPEEVQQMVRKVAVELQSMEFAQSLVTSSSTTKSSDTKVQTDDEIIAGIMSELVDEKEDWFSNMSGGQRSKVELTRTVFLKDHCPDVLLVDETMAPLDPRSKALVMGKLKNFCAGSVVIVIYHTDVGREIEGMEGGVIECVPSNDFFDANIHVENKLIHIRPVC
jgi:ATPase subunit of ABC transporter with duplicated ATPase domains